MVVAFWPEVKDLDQLDERPGLKALVVVSPTKMGIERWRRVRAAVDLLGVLPVLDAPTISEPTAANAMESLTLIANLANGM